MPQMADVTVKANDGTTNVVYVAMSPSAGDRVPSQWRVNAANARANLRPKFELVSQKNGAGTARRLQAVFRYPCVETLNGVETLVATVPIDVTWTIPLNATDTAIAEAVSQFANLLASTLIKDSVKAGFAPT